MKTAILLVMVSTLAFAPHLDEKDRLNQLLAERVKANQEILKENLEAYESVDNSKEWKKVEKESSAALIELIEYCQKSDDNKLKRMVLRNEYYMELIFSMSEKDFATDEKKLGEGNAAENDAAIKEASERIEKFRKKLLELGDAVQ